MREAKTGKDPEGLLVPRPKSRRIPETIVCSILMLYFTISCFITIPYYILPYHIVPECSILVFMQSFRPLELDRCFKRHASMVSRAESYFVLS